LNDLAKLDVDELEVERQSFAQVKAARKMSVKLTPGPNFTNVDHA